MHADLIAVWVNSYIIPSYAAFQTDVAAVYDRFPGRMADREFCGGRWGQGDRSVYRGHGRTGHDPSVLRFGLYAGGVAQRPAQWADRPLLR